MNQTREIKKSPLVVRLVDPTTERGLEAMTFPSYRSLLLQSTSERVCIMGGYIEETLVILLVAMRVADGLWEILSVFTCKAHRAQGYATQVVAFFCEHLQSLGGKHCTLKYMTHKENTPALEHLLDAVGFEPAEPRQFVIRGELSRMQKAPWTRLFRDGLPEGFSIKYWRDLSFKEREALQSAITHETWVPKDLNPFDFEPDYAPALSLALMFEGEVVGWSITHLLDAQTLRYTNLYIKASLQLRGQFIALVNHTMALMAHEGLRYGSWAVCVAYEKTIAFYKKHLIPYCVWSGYSVSRSIALERFQTCETKKEKAS